MSSLISASNIKVVPGGSLSADNVQAAIGELDSAVGTLDSGKAAKSTIVTATLSAASWTGTSAPYSYSLTVNGVTVTSNQELLPTTDITKVQLDALLEANIQDAGQSSNTITLKAWELSRPLICQ